MILFVLVARTVVSQISIEPVQNAPTTVDLTSRLAASGYVIFGTVVGREIVPELMTLEQMREKGANHRYGVLHTIRVDESLCQQADFHARPGPSESQRIDLGPEIFIFIPIEEIQYVERVVAEWLVEGEQYLMLLKDDPHQSEHVATFGLDGNRRYLRGAEYGNGVVRLPGQVEGDESSDLAITMSEGARDLCEAVRPAGYFQKIDHLQKLRSIGDPEMQRNAQSALEALNPAER